MTTTRSGSHVGDEEPRSGIFMESTSSRAPAVNGAGVRHAVRLVVIAASAATLVYAMEELLVGFGVTG